MSLGATAEWHGGMTIGNWYLDSLGMSRQGMMSVLKDFFEFDWSKNTLVSTPV